MLYQTDYRLREDHWTTLPGLAVTLDDRSVGPVVEPGLHCASCQRRITAPDQQIERNGCHHRRVTNPAGLVFNIGCFATAEGCYPRGQPTDQHSWFSGFAWQIAQCRSCHYQLGWRFTGDATSFYGLILDRLIAISD